MLADAADYGSCASHSRYFWGFRLHALFVLNGPHHAPSPTTSQEPVELVI